MKRLILAFFCLTALSMALHPVISANWSDCAAFPETCSNNDSGKSTTKSQMLSQFIVNGGVNLLTANSRYQEFLAVVEKNSYAPANIDEYKALISECLLYVDIAEYNYFWLWIYSLSYSVNPATVEKLMNFDYDGFSQQYGLNAVIFNELRSYLQCGDIHGLYRRIFEDTQKIKTKILGMLHGCDSGILPHITAVWKCNQMFSNYILFSQYVSQVFHSL